METSRKKTGKSNKILLCIERIATWAKDSNLSPAFIKKCAPSARALSNYLDCNEIQAILFSIVCNLNFNRGSVDVNDMARYLNSAPVRVIRYVGEFEELCNRKILQRDYEYKRFRGKRVTNLNQIQYVVNKGVVGAILNNEKLVARKMEKLDLYSLIESVKVLFDERENGKSSFEEMVLELRLLMEENRHQVWIDELIKMELTDENLCIFFYMCQEFANDNTSVDLADMLKALFRELRTQLNLRKDFIEGDNDLVRKDLVALEDGFFRSDRNLKLTDQGIDLFLKDDRKLFDTKKSRKKPDFILHSDIPEKKLFFRAEEEEKLDFLTHTLLPDNFSQLTARLKESGMKEGVAILMHGPPGTGKTESAYQIARKTGRDIKLVVISETKSMWFGESEKLIKGVFDSYRKLVENSKIAPVLLFNEADAIFSTRKQIGQSAVDQTENAIQNIILQEMEDLNGILIATTNMTQNLDKAFERRFLYKILFDKPSQEAMVHIWKNKIPKLPQKQAILLAQQYQLSGGQIDNVARKCLTAQILHGAMPALVEILAFCEEETLERGRISMLGFRYTHHENMNR